MFFPVDILYDIQKNIKEVTPNLFLVKSKTKVDVAYVLLDKKALHAGINIIYGLKGLHQCSISSQSLILSSEKDLPRLWLRKV